MSGEPVLLKFWVKDLDECKNFLSDNVKLSDTGKEYLRNRCKTVKCKKCGEDIDFNFDNEEIICKSGKNHKTGWDWSLPWMVENAPSFIRTSY